MQARQQRAVWLLGLCQCILWGVLYYSFSVLLVPMEQGLGLPRSVVAGAWSVALLAAALLAPIVGRRLDAGQAAGLFRGGSLLAVAGLALVALATDAWLLYLGWLLIGVSMATLLYEPAFALIARAFVDDAPRLRALAAVTVLGGLASTVFLPLLSWFVMHWGWQLAVLACTVPVLAAAWILDQQVVPGLLTDARAGPAHRARAVDWPPMLPALAAVFAFGTLATMALATLLIPLMIERGVAPSTAALVLAALGVAQLPGRLWLLRGRQANRAIFHVLPMVLQGTGLLGVALTRHAWLVALAVAVFGVGAGLHAVARPWLVHCLCGAADAARWNGEVARIQGFARAAGPAAAAGAASVSGAPAVLAVLGALLLLGPALVRRLPR